METFAYGITTAYSARNLFPFSQYGENAFLAVSDIIILALFFLYGPGGTLQPNAKSLIAVLVGSVGFSLWLASETLCPPVIRECRHTATRAYLANDSHHITRLDVVSALQASTVPLTVLSKAPQIASNHRLRSTGNLSAFAVFNSFLGCAVRVFTTGQETGDSLVWWGYFLAAVCNAILVGQMVLYWRNSESSEKSSGKDFPLTSLGYNDRKKA
jgi:mannose-P-dolichol utilization defect protein 1